MNRIIIVGATGSGKTSLAQRISKRLRIPHIEIDSIYWGAGWKPISLDDFRKQIDQTTLGEKWVLDGNYSKIRDLTWGRADTLVWLDYPFLLVFRRLLKRCIPRVFSHQELWNGNHETFRGMFFSRDSLFIWLIQSYPRQKKSYPKLATEPAYSHLTFIRLRSPQQADQWLNEIV